MRQKRHFILTWRQLTARVSCWSWANMKSPTFGVILRARCSSCFRALSRWAMMTMIQTITRTRSSAQLIWRSISTRRRAPTRARKKTLRLEIRAAEIYWRQHDVYSTLRKPAQNRKSCCPLCNAGSVSSGQNRKPKKRHRRIRRSSSTASRLIRRAGRAPSPTEQEAHAAPGQRHSRAGQEPYLSGGHWCADAVDVGVDAARPRLA